MGEAIAGGCQCGAVRFSVERLGGAAICHCRMCQKAFGGFFGPLVTGHGVVWTRGAPSYFQSSNRFRRGFCSACGTPLTYEALDRKAGDPVELAIGALDDPNLAPPSRQLSHSTRLSYVDGLAALPTRQEDQDWFDRAGIVSRQHPDHDTKFWPTQGGTHG